MFRFILWFHTMDRFDLAISLLFSPIHFFRIWQDFIYPYNYVMQITNSTYTDILSHWLLWNRERHVITLLSRCWALVISCITIAIRLGNPDSVCNIVSILLPLRTMSLCRLQHYYCKFQWIICWFRARCGVKNNVEEEKENEYINPHAKIAVWYSAMFPKLEQNVECNAATRNSAFPISDPL